VCGDHWVNPDEVEQQVRQIAPGVPVMVDMSTEGASMRALGVCQMLDRYLDRDQITVRAWANPVEQIPYRRADTHLYSHFFWMAQRYWNKDLAPNTHERRFACLIGRLTWPRIRMLWDLRQYLGDRCLFSVMDPKNLPRADAYNLDRQENWVAEDFDYRMAIGDMTSLDGHQVRDQYDPQHNTNLSILDHYARFDLEIVAETYCHGPAFLPTEKTIRPLLYRKPIMVYGPRHFLRNLRSQGFSTWSDWWDESYDDLEGPARWQAMMEQISLLNLHEHFNQILDDCQSVLEHNRDRARKIGQRHQPQ
jgi:hypothetical protein